MNKEWTNDRVRQLADELYVQPAKNSRSIIRIQQGDLYDKACSLGLPKSNPNMIGSAIEADKFWKTRHLEMLTPRKQSRARETVYEYRFISQPFATDAAATASRDDATETPSERAFRLTERVRGLLKDEIKAFGGTEAFMRWVRSDDEDAA